MKAQSLIFVHAFGQDTLSVLERIEGGILRAGEAATLTPDYRFVAILCDDAARTCRELIADGWDEGQVRVSIGAR